MFEKSVSWNLQERKKAIPLQPLSGERAQVTETTCWKILLRIRSGLCEYLTLVLSKGARKSSFRFPWKTFSKKTSEKFGRMKKSIYLCIRFPIKTEAEKKRDLW